MQKHASLDATPRTAQRRTGLAARQARVGIVANAVDIRFPAHSPREVWVRWPKLRSARRMNRDIVATDAAGPEGDPVLNGARLKDFTDELRKSEMPVQPAADAVIVLEPREVLAPPFERARLATRLALGVTVAGVALVALSLALR